MYTRILFLFLVILGVNSYPSYNQPNVPRASTSLSKEDLSDSLPWIKFHQLGNILTLFPKIISDIAEAGPKIETDTNKFQVIINVKDYKKMNLKAQIKGEFIVIEGFDLTKNSFHDSLTSRFSQTYSLPLSASASSVTAVLTSDGYLVVNAPLGGVVKRNRKINKNIQIVESREPLQTQNLYKPIVNTTPISPLYKINEVPTVTQKYQNNFQNRIFEVKPAITIPVQPETKKEEILKIPFKTVTQKTSNIFDITGNVKTINTLNDNSKTIEIKSQPQVVSEIQTIITENPIREFNSNKNENVYTQFYDIKMTLPPQDINTFMATDSINLPTTLPPSQYLKSSLSDFIHEEKEYNIFSTTKPLLEVTLNEENINAKQINLENQSYDNNDNVILFTKDLSNDEHSNDIATPSPRDLITEITTDRTVFEIPTVVPQSQNTEKDVVDVSSDIPLLSLMLNKINFEAQSLMVEEPTESMVAVFSKKQDISMPKLDMSSEYISEHITTTSFLTTLLEEKQMTNEVPTNPNIPLVTKEPLAEIFIITNPTTPLSINNDLVVKETTSTLEVIENTSTQKINKELFNNNLNERNDLFEVQTLPFQNEVSVSGINTHSTFIPEILDSTTTSDPMLETITEIVKTIKKNTSISVTNETSENNTFVGDSETTLPIDKTTLFELRIAETPNSDLDIIENNSRTEIQSPVTEVLKNIVSVDTTQATANTANKNLNDVLDIGYYITDLININVNTEQPITINYYPDSNIVSPNLSPVQDTLNE